MTSRLRRRPFAALLALTLGACLHPTGTKERPAVTSFQITGTKAVDAGDLRSRLVTQPSGRWVWSDTEYYDEDAFANDRRRILRYYAARGFYHASIESAEVTPDGEGRVKVEVRVSEGEPVKVATLEVVGMQAAPEASAKLKRLPLAVGDVFTEAAYDLTRTTILAALTSTGWAQAEVAQMAHVDPISRTANVRYTVTTGERFRFGGVFVAGARVIPRARIREEAELVIKPGSIYDATQLPRAQARVFDLGVFGGVRVGAGPPEPTSQTIPVVVSVREAPFRTIRAGPAITVQGNARTEADMTAGWSHRNWLGGLRKLNLDVRAGYAWLPNIFRPDKHGFVGLVTADFTQPGILTRYVDLNLRGELERGLELAYDFWAERIRIGTPIKFGRTFSIVPSFNLEAYELTGTATQADPATGNVLFLSTCPGSNPNLCFLSYFEQRAVLDLRDDPLLTTKGLFVSLAVQEGVNLFGLGVPYLRFLPEARGFVSLPYRMVAAARARIGIARSLSTDDIPIVSKFMSGGANLMRGYYTRMLSPVLYSTSGQNYLPVGGNGLVDGSFELRFPIVGNLGGSTFLDFGNVTTSVEDALNLSNLQYAVGAGIRYMTIFGPIRVDVAGRLPQPGGGQPGVELMQLRGVCTTGVPDASGNCPDGKPPPRSVLERVGTHHEPIISIHVSIGEAF